MENLQALVIPVIARALWIAAALAIVALAWWWF